MLLHLIKNKLAWLLLPILTACHNHTAYHSYQPIPLEGWGKRDTLVFNLPSSFPHGIYSLEIGIRYQETYPYRDLWLAISQNLKDSSNCTTDTLHLFLTDEDGNKTQNSPGGLYQYSAACPTAITVEEKETPYHFHIIQIMKDNPLKGITDVGIRLTHTQK